MLIDDSRFGRDIRSIIRLSVDLIMVRFVSLDAFRGIAALVIVLLHARHSFPTVWIPADEHIYLLVDFFFVLSGFVISHAYAQRLQTRDDVAVFILRRVGRVWPLNAVLMMVLFAIELLKAAGNALGLISLRPFEGFSDINNFVEGLLLFNSFGLTHELSWNVPSWSISAEMMAYLLFALVVYLALPLRIAALILVGLAVALMVAAGSPGLTGTYEMGLPRGIAGFFAGCVTYSIHSNARRAGPPAMWSALEVIVIAGVVTFLALAKESALSYVAPLVFGIAVYVFAADAGLISRILRLGVFTLLGRLSYSIYMTHFVILGIIVSAVRVVERLAPNVAAINYPLENDLAVVLFLSLVLGVSSLTYRFIELPGIALFRHFERTRQATA